MAESAILTNPTTALRSCNGCCLDGSYSLLIARVQKDPAKREKQGKAPDAHVFCRVKAKARFMGKASNHD